LTSEFLNQLKSDEYSNILTEMNAINKKYNTNDIEYIIPATKCQKCGKDIQEEPKNPLDMLFTRHQLVVIANISTN
jgi:predicted Zn-ribbon and HTH transcriptional regulator